MSAAFGYVDGYIGGQHDALTWLAVPGDDDHPLVAFDPAVQMRAALVCLSRNLAIAGGLCAAWKLGWNSNASFPILGNDWRPGCGRSAP